MTAQWNQSMGRDLFTFRWPLSPSGPINERYGLNRQVSVLCVSIDYTVKICHQCFVMSPLILPTDIAYRPIVPVSRHGLDFLHCICFRCNFYNPLTSPLNFSLNFFHRQRLFLQKGLENAIGIAYCRRFKDFFISSAHHPTQSILYKSNDNSTTTAFESISWKKLKCLQ